MGRKPDAGSPQEPLAHETAEQIASPDLRKARKAASLPKRRPGKSSALELVGPSPNPATNLAIADIALRGGMMLARLAVERALLGSHFAPRKARQILKGRTIRETMLHRAIASVALSSVPGAIAVTGGIVAKTLYDRSKANKAKVEGHAKLADMAERGEED